MSLEFKPLENSIGVECCGLDLSKPIDDSDAQALFDAWVEAGIILFRNTGHSPEQQIRLSQVFGTTEEHPAKFLVQEEKYRELMILDSDAQQKLSIYENDDNPGERFTGYIPWHQDMIFVPKPNHGALLRAVVVPGRGGETGWIDIGAAYDSLPEEMKSRIEGLEAEYHFCTNHTKGKFGVNRKVRKVAGNVDNLPDFPPVAHPLVMNHPISGRKILNISPLHLVGMFGMDPQEGDALLNELIDHIYQSRFSYVHRWQPDDMVLWDNWRVLHQAFGWPVEERRLMQRTQILGDVEMGRVLQAS